MIIWINISGNIIKADLHLYTKNMSGMNQGRDISKIISQFLTFYCSVLPFILEDNPGLLSLFFFKNTFY